jgi:hypothetical protein
MTGTIDPIRLLEKNLERQIESIRGSDVKITLLVPTMTAMTGVLAAMLRGANLGMLPRTYILLSIIPIAIAYAQMGLSVIPRMRIRSSSLLFFGSIATHAPPDYVAAIRSLTRDAYVEDLAEQCHTSARIARDKYRHVRNAYLAFFVALPLWTVAIYLLSGS